MNLEINTNCYERVSTLIDQVCLALCDGNFASGCKECGFRYSKFSVKLEFLSVAQNDSSIGCDFRWPLQS